MFSARYQPQPATAATDRNSTVVDRNTLVQILGWHALPIQGDVLFVERLAWVKRRLLRGPARTLDAGCGTGALTILATRLGHEALGLTFTPADAELAARRAAILGAATARFEVVDLRKLDQAIPRLGTFDQVIACEVIEHLKDDRRLVVNLAKLLKPGGRLLLTTPFLKHHPVYGERVSETEDGGHVRFGYTHEELEELIELAGLNIEEKGFLNGYFSQRVFSLYLRLQRWHPKFGWFFTLPFRPLRVFDGFVSRMTRYPHMSVTVVAVKNATACAI